MYRYICIGVNPKNGEWRRRLSERERERERERGRERERERETDED